MSKFFTSLPFKLVLCILCAFILGRYLPLSIISFFYTISAMIIDMLMFVLPFMVFAFIFNAIEKLNKGSLWLVLSIFVGITLSNILSLSVAYFFAQTVLPFLQLEESQHLTTQLHSAVKPLFRLPLPPLLNTGMAMAFAMILAISSSFLEMRNRFRKNLHDIVNYLLKSVLFFLQKIFTPLLPLYVFGFCLKLSYDQALSALFHSYGKVFMLSSVIIWIYIPLIYLLASKGSIRKALNYMKKMLPACLTGFSTMSSAATMPVTIKCTQENLHNEALTDLIIPTTTNTHLLGDNITITLSAMALLTFFGMPQPTLTTFIPYMLIYSLTALSCVGVPGGTILIMLPVLQNFLNFTPEMLSAITTIYVLQDPFGTTANVIGNGGFALFMQRFFYKDFIKF